jgi:hypothetical protein
MSDQLSKVNCPKCKSKTLTLVECWKDHTIEWEQENGKFRMQDGCLNPGDAYKVQARCSECNHAWTIRGALQISDVCL